MKKPKLNRLRLRHRYSSKVGQPPGVISHTGDSDAIATVQELRSFEHHQWVEVTGFGDIELLQSLQTDYQLDPMIMEDILNTFHRSKIECTENGLLILAKRVLWNSAESTGSTHQFCLWLDNERLITFNEKGEGFLDPIHKRMENRKGKLHTRAQDYLCFAIFDLLVDHYLLQLMTLEDRLEEIEIQLDEVQNYNPSQELNQLKKIQLEMKNIVDPLRDGLGRILRELPGFIEKQNRIYYQDIHDHLIQAGSQTERIHMTIVNLKEAYLSKLNLRMNKTMHLLTLVATIFIPLTFIAGIYGMNFSYMPELAWKNGYFIILGVMSLIGIGLLILFKTRKWF